MPYAAAVQCNDANGRLYTVVNAVVCDLSSVKICYLLNIKTVYNFNFGLKLFFYFLILFYIYNACTILE